MHSEGFSREELLSARPVVRQNLIDSMRALLESVLEEGEKFEEVANADGKNCGQDGDRELHLRTRTRETLTPLI